MPDFKHPDAGARELLRAVTQRPPHGQWSAEQGEARRAKLAELLNQTVELFISYGIKAQAYPDTYARNPVLSGTWHFRTSENGVTLELVVDSDGDLLAQRRTYSGVTPVEFACPVMWDVAEMVWLGEPLGDRDPELHGYPLRRQSPLESLTRAILLAAGLEGSK